ncbi:DNA-binding response regulator [Lonsdalea britannica]|uniref:DNA-binding response regulator n=1 Tax=Lonsdalea britannica TaxID=1082704 RepID=A0AAD0SF97_9GAMM|nr:response regulator transcription factor [Lonsdalea britannica]AXW86245.1 DNA-binding response regulator [Lonsdalea britannica]OSM94375.1 DNA-binding response regulator [Lonsdalea britannica]OSN06013.1 DNA-binding response regulator [Lonsdalea britannica]
MRILVVDDDTALCQWLDAKLHACGHTCRVLHDGGHALTAIQQEVYDVVLLDRMLPVMEGFTLLRELQDRPHPPIMLLSTLDLDVDRVMGLELGAEDYLGKPFNFDELRLRLEIMVGRGRRRTESGSVLTFFDLKVDCLQRTVWRGEKRIELTDKEIKLLIVLMETPGKVFSRTQLLERVWGYRFNPQTNLIDVHMSKLRAKIDKGFTRPLIKTQRSVGYCLSLEEKALPLSDDSVNSPYHHV